ncbi:MAG: hypothetical protein AAGA75_13950 [Cyanobacteria bacterium P01_E01_bin.6]
MMILTFSIALTARTILILRIAARNRFAEASHGVLGYDGLSTKEIAQISREQLLEYPTAHFVEGKAIRAERQLDESFLVELESGVRYQSQRIILAIGVVDHLPGIPGLAERWGKQLINVHTVTAMNLPVVVGAYFTQEKLLYIKPS